MGGSGVVSKLLPSGAAELWLRNNGESSAQCRRIFRSAPARFGRALGASRAGDRKFLGQRKTRPATPTSTLVNLTQHQRRCCKTTCFKENIFDRHRAMRQGDRSGQAFRAAVAHSIDLSVWQIVQAFGIFSLSVSLGVTKWKVWLRTRWSEIVSATFGM